jgi:hypothetical protein
MMFGPTGCAAVIFAFFAEGAAPTDRGDGGGAGPVSAQAALGRRVTDAVPRWREPEPPPLVH